MLAPVMPHITEEIHSLFFAEREGTESIHTGGWPEVPPAWRDPAALEAGQAALAVVEGMRKVKSTLKVSVAAPVKVLRIVCDDAAWARIEPLLPELRDVANAQTVERAAAATASFVETPAPGILVEAELAQAAG
jgi:valyl-tRNA synthetase